MYHMLRTMPAGVYLLILCGLVAANSAVYRTMLAPQVPTITVFDVGKGDAALVRSPRGRTLLIDAGPDASVLRALGNTLPMWQRRIDALIFTDAKAASVGGLSDVALRYRVPAPMPFGGEDAPYGTTLAFDTDVSITVISPGTFDVSYGTTRLSVSSSTPPGTYPK